MKILPDLRSSSIHVIYYNDITHQRAKKIIQNHFIEVQLTKKVEKNYNIFNFDALRALIL
jgi:hypothetical protein